jgi:hypothetical protein
MRVNGEFDIPFKVKKTTALLETFFTSGERAGKICNKLNKVELKKMEQLQEAVEKGIVTLGQIIDKKYF